MGERKRHVATREIVCPHCDFEFSDSWEHDGDTAECPECEKKFAVERDHDVTFTTYIPDPPNPPRERVAPAPDLAFMEGIPEAVPRTGSFSVYQTSLNIWEEHVDEAGARAVLQGLLAVLYARGFSVTHDPRILESWPEAANAHWYASGHGPGGKLEVVVELSGCHLKVEFFQSINVENSSGGRYDSDKFRRMPRAMQLRCIATMFALIQRLGLHGYVANDRHDLPTLGTVIDVRDAMSGAFQKCGGDPLKYFNRCWGADRFKRDETGFIDEKEYKGWSSVDRDGVKLRTADVRLFYKRGRLMRGTVYPDVNGRWIVAFRGEVDHHDPRELFSADPSTVPRRLVPKQRQRLEAELEKAVKVKRFARVAVLGGVLARMGETG